MPAEILNPALQTFEEKPYFYTDDGLTVVFEAPVNGVTTSGSGYPRSELRQMKPGGGEASWSNSSQTWTMECSLAFTILPGGKPHVVGMQIHDSNDDVTVLRLEGSDLWITKGDNTHHQKIMSGYVLGTRLNMKVVARAGGGIRWYKDGVDVGGITGKFSGCYFKTGCYTQANTSNGSGKGQVVVYANTLKVYKS